MFRGDTHWRSWARLALRAAGATWAGGGHLLVPYSEQGEVADTMLAAVAAFDPDHVVLLSPSLADHEEVAPGSLQLYSNDRLLEGAERAAAIKAGLTFRPDDPVGDRARDLVAAACTPFKTEFPGVASHEMRTHIETDGSTGFRLDAQDLLGTDATYAAVPRGWTSDTALFVGALVGIEPDDERPRDDSEPAPAELLRYAMGRPRPAPPIGMVSEGAAPPPGEVPTWFDVLDIGVTAIARDFSRSAGAVVIGDGPTDFALAVAAQRLRGFGWWLTLESLRDAELMRTAILPVLSRRLREDDDGVRSIAITSTTLSDEQLNATVAELSAALTTWSFYPRPGEDLRASPPPDWSGDGSTYRVVSDGIGDERTVPVEREDSGTMTMLTRLALPVPKEPSLTRGMPAWYVDVEFTEGVMPAGRGVPCSALRAGQHPEYTNVRSGRDGLSVIAQSYGFIPAGAVLSSAMTRPVLRDLGIYAWVEQMAEHAGLSANYSTPGQHAQLIAQRLGARTALVDLVAGPLHPMLRCFRLVDTRKADPRSNDPSSQPIVILDSTTPYLTIDRMCEAVPSVEPAEVRSRVDDLCRRRIARRGLILGCLECGRPSFLGVDDLGQTYRCPRCGAANDLEAGRWRLPTSEPHWFYDLHNSFRELLTTGGDVPLLAAANLRAGARRYADCAEVEFREKGKRVGEADLVAHIDGKVVLVEAKSTGMLGHTVRERRSTAAKKARIAAAIRADEVVLATTDERWGDADVEALTAALTSGTRGRPVPGVRCLAGLTAN
jgi:hypothetical protein